MKSLHVLGDRIEACTKCPRLVRWREKVAKVKRKAYAEERYHGKPVRGFGDPNARIVIVGLAPGAHGANRTGRVFTGDRSGDFLYAALHRAGLASQEASTRAGDGLALERAYILLAVRCAPPDNKPTPPEIRKCQPWLDEEIALLPQARVFLALGSIAVTAILHHYKRLGVKHDKFVFGHGTEMKLGDRLLLASYHVSQQNTLTGKLTPAMFDRVVKRAKV
ncbi:MAG TPA: uracil-DNA glycosylase, partial [Polyangiaceae bacterium]